MAFFKIIASQIGSSAGPFVIKSNTGAILATGVTRAQLLAGFSFNVPTGVTSVTLSNMPSNVTCTGTTTFEIPNEGFWEMEKAGVETVSDHYGSIAAGYVAPVETFVADDIVGIYTGVVSGTTWLIKSGPEDIAGTTYNGGGLLIATGVNTNSSTTVESGAILQLGYDLDSYTGQMGGTLNIAAGGTVNVMGANEPTGRVAFAGLVNDGALNITGPDRCGEGYFRTSGPINNRSLITIEDANFAFLNATTFGTGVGTILVKDGATLEQSALTVPATQTIQLNGCGKCNEIGKQDGAMLVIRDTTIAATIELQTDVCIDHVGIGNTTISGRVTGNHKLMLNNQADSTTRSGSFSFTSSTAPFFDNTIEVKNVGLYQQGANALSKADVVLIGTALIQQDAGTINIGSLTGEETTGIMANSSVTVVLKENGSTTYAGSMSNSTPGTPWTFRIEGPDTNVIKLTDTTGNTAVDLNSITGGRVIVENGRYRQWTGVGTISAGNTRSSGSFVNSRIDLLTIGASSALDVYASGSTTGLLTGGTTSAAAGWKVNLMEPLPAGTHQILRKQATPIAPPTLGTNLSGRTVVGFTDSGNYITVTLA